MSGRARGGAGRTDNEAFHLVLAQHVHAQSVADLVVEFVGAASRGHDAQLAGAGAVELEVLVPEVLHELYAVVDAVCLKALEVEAATGLGRVGLAREVDELDERAADLGQARLGRPWGRAVVKEGGGDAGLTSMAMWLTTAVWLGSRMSLVSWWRGLEPLAWPLASAGVEESGSTMKAPLTLILTLPGLVMVLSISSVDVAVLGL